MYELVTKCALICVIGHCCSCYGSFLPSLCNGLCISATARTKILEYHVIWSAVVCEFQGCPANSALTAAFSLSETRLQSQGYK